MEDQKDWSIVGGANLLLGVGLVLSKQFRVELDVSWLVDTVDVSEGGGNGEVLGDGGEGGIDIVDVFWLGVEGSIVNIFVVDTVFLTTSDTDFLRLLISL